MKKTITKEIDKKYNTIFDLMTEQSKNIFNSCIFHNKIFTLFKKEIYNDVYKLSKTKDIIDDKSYQFVLFKQVYHKYYELYVKYKNIIKENNKIIYKYLINVKPVITTINFNNEYTKFINEIKVNIPDNKYKFIFLDNIVENILKSFYRTNFNIIKNDLVKHKKFSIDNDDLIEDVRNNRTIETDFNIRDIKNKIEKNLKHTVKSQQFIFKKVIYQKKYIQLNILPADIILNIIDKYYECLTSYFGKIKLGLKVSKPKYKSNDNKYNLFYFTSSFKIVDYKIRINIGKYFKENLMDHLNVEQYKTKYYYKNNIKKKKQEDYIKISKNKYYNKNDLINGNYIYIKYPRFLNNVKYCEVIPFYNNYKIKIMYETDNLKIKKVKENKKNSISIDLGMKNLMTIYNPNGKQHIITGNKIKQISNYYNKKIDKLKSINKKLYNKEISKNIINLINNKTNKINGYINRLVSALQKTYKNVKNIIVGYNEFWNQSINLGKQTNRRFTKIPFIRILNKVAEKFNLIKTEESYTSKCDSLALETIKKQDHYLGKRVKRGLFLSSIKKVINADLNSAINIIRKKINLKIISGINLGNPTIIKID